MTQDYRKRAEEFIVHYSCEDPWYSCPKSGEGCANEAAGTECDCGYEDKISKLQNTFQQIAQEARREENEACAQLLESIYEGHITDPRWLPVFIQSTKAIRARMEVK